MDLADLVQPGDGQVSIVRTLGAAALMSATLAPAAQAVEGGIGAYFLGTRDSFAGVVPPPGTYLSFSYDHLKGDVTGVSIGGLPIRADSEVTVDLLRLGITHSFDADVLGGQPALNLTVPILDVGLGFTAITPPLAGSRIDDSTSGVGDIIFTPMVGWNRGKLNYSAALSVYAPTGNYDTATIDVPNRSIDALSNGKNVWSFQPVFAATWFNPQSGLELSGTASMLFSTRNKATDYQTAPAVQLEAAVLQHTKSGWAFGVTGYHYEQIRDDSGSGAVGTRAALGARSLRAKVSGAGPIITYSGVSLFGGQASFELKYTSEFNAKRRFESDILSLNMSVSF
ncbi:hypothetical protein C1J05_14255 [Sulfitobacter sp. JL08]|uniref:SphA family protein n=1 Tax=Sulfitobacter sp. JL08 TaxID=2070369 RepID=UPI000E0C3097|nr:transporter [Sulfitobacter sp. JL08]AXI55513.1 hypothetical protein C1J05_14255 [Sulfitobacter sp. JL08]